jgi:hypothetical protein
VLSAYLRIIPATRLLYITLTHQRNIYTQKNSEKQDISEFFTAKNLISKNNAAQPMETADFCVRLYIQIRVRMASDLIR